MAIGEDILNYYSQPSVMTEISKDALVPSGVWLELKVA
jgi:hypothetical protein